MDFSNLAGVATAVISDTRYAVNPFGIRDSQGRAFEALIRRANHPDWTDAIADLLNNDPEWREKREETLRIQLAAGATGTKGFRQRAKLSPDDVQNRVVGSLAKHFAAAPDRAVKERQLVEKKKTAAEHLFVGGRYLESAEGPVDLSDPAKRLELFTAFNDSAGKPVKVTNQYLLEGDGSPILIAGTEEMVENPWLGKFMGDALLDWMEAEAAETALYFQADMEDARDFSGGGHAGSTASGLPKTETPAELQTPGSPSSDA